MLKFLRKYQKWMLVVFCVGLMIAFLAPQAVQQFTPDPAQRPLATLYGDQELSRDELTRAATDLKNMKLLRFDPIRWPGLSLLPDTGRDEDDALHWLLIQRAAEHNNLSASNSEAFNLAADILTMYRGSAAKPIQKSDDVGPALKEAKLPFNDVYLYEICKQYLKAEQYRQLVGGIEYTVAPGNPTPIGSPGLQRHLKLGQAVGAIREIGQQLISLGYPPEQAEFLAVQSVLMERGMLPQIVGHQRVSTQQVRYLLQQQMTEISLSVVLIDAEDRMPAVTVSDDEVRAVFERFADEEEGKGQPYGLGYRVPDRVKLEALRIPIDQARAVVADEITPDDIVKFYNENQGSFIEFEDLPEGESIKPAELTVGLREKIRTFLTQQRAIDKVNQVAEMARLRLKEDERGLSSDGPYKVLPDDFAPMPLVELAAEIEREHGITPEVIQINDWVSAEQINAEAEFTGRMMESLPTSTIRLPGGTMSRPIRETLLAGRAGLFATHVPGLLNSQAFQLKLLSNYIEDAKPFVKPDSDAALLGLQLKLPGEVLSDFTGSSYVFRLTDADPAHPATDMTPIAAQLKTDATRVKAYEQIVSEKDQMIDRAAEQSIETLMISAQDKATLDVSRLTLARTGAPPMKGLRTTGPILEQAFGVADKILSSGGLDSALARDRLFAVELAGDYKLAIVRIDDIRPLTRSAFERTADNPSLLSAAAGVGATGQPPSPMSIESLKLATGFKWAEGEDPADDEEEDGEPAPQ